MLGAAVRLLAPIGVLNVAQALDGSKRPAGRDCFVTTLNLPPQGLAPQYVLAIAVACVTAVAFVVRFECLLALAVAGSARSAAKKRMRRRVRLIAQ